MDNRHLGSGLRMRILIVSGFFPPFAPIAGVRPGKFAKYLLGRGYDVRVLAARDLPYPRLLPLEIPQENVTYTDWIDVNAISKRLARVLRGAQPDGNQKATIAVDERKPGNPANRSTYKPLHQILRKLSAIYTDATNWPDPQIGWLPYALRDGTKLLNGWRADLIYATAPPLTGLLVAHKLARRFSIPWIAEFRDLWVDHPYYDAPNWRRRFEHAQERAVMRSASGLVTVSDGWRNILQEKFGKPTITILNGFDPDDYPPDTIPSESDRRELTILYTGTLYAGRRDPTPLFRAIACLGERGRRVRALFYGAAPKTVFHLADSAGVRRQVDVHEAVPYDIVTRLQRTADVLLLLRWNDPSESGVVPGKLFEYVGARRPILCFGTDKGTVPEIVRARGLGLVSEDPGRIAEQLGTWLDIKERTGSIPPLPSDARSGLSRIDQFTLLEGFLHSIVKPALQPTDDQAA